jgi:hypothetical protein
MAEQADARQQTHFDITFDAAAAIARVDKMIATLASVPVPAELTAWQSEDMKRRYPETEVLNATSARTRIYPRSRRDNSWLKQKRPPRRAKPMLRGKATRIGKPIVPTSNRPILRPILFERLRERMNLMMQREIKW